MEGGEVQVIPGREKRTYILHINDGYYYNIREVRGNRFRLQCRHFSVGCRATAAANLTTGILHHLQPHTCQPDPLLPADIQFRRELIENARQNDFGAGVRHILRNLKLRCLNPALASRFTTVRMQSAMYMARSENYPAIPETLSYLGVLLGVPDMQAVCRTVDQQDYIFRGVTGVLHNKSVSIIFASGRMLQFLQSRTNLHLDGTFKKRPRKPKCGQVYNIVTNYDSTIIAIVRVLMMRRTEIAYEALFSRLRTLAPNLQPTRLHCDFERAPINALRRAFPNCPIFGCLWHYAVCCSSKANKLGLTPLAANNDLVFGFIRCLCGAPLLPSALISQGVEEVWEEVRNTAWAQELAPLFEYFRQEWLPRVAELSVFDCPERTNNCSESDNRMLANVLPQNRPNIWRLIGGFVQAEYLSWNDKLASDRGDPVNCQRRWKTVANDARVRTMTRMLVSDQITPGHFLHSVSYVVLGAVNHGLRLGNDSDSDSDSD